VHTELKEGDAVRPLDTRQIYYYTKGILRPIPNIDAFLKLGLDFEKVVVIHPYEINNYTIGSDITNKENQ
jgi:hypothetical protein